MDRLSDLMPRVLNKRGLKGQAQAAQATWIARQWLTEQLPLNNEEIHIDRFAEATLWLSVDSAIAAQECQQIVHMLQDHLKKELGVPVESVRITRSS